MTGRLRLPEDISENFSRFAWKRDSQGLAELEVGMLKLLICCAYGMLIMALKISPLTGTRKGNWQRW